MDGIHAANRSADAVRRARRCGRRGRGLHLWPDPARRGGCREPRRARSRSSSDPNRTLRTDRRMSEETMDERLVAMESEMDRAVMLDGNAAAGMLEAIFGGDMTAVPSQCDNCGDVAMMGTLHAYTQGPGMVLRCAI